MCRLASWVEVDIKDKKVIYFLDKNKLRGKEGNELKKYLGSKYDNDVVGHGAIRYYYPELKGIGKDREVNDFSNPKRFPKIIADSIKAGDFDCFFDSRLVNMLNDKGREEYLKIEQPAYDKYLKIQQPAYEEYYKIQQPAYKEYLKIEQPAYKEYLKIQQPAYKEYYKTIQPAYKEYLKIEQPAYKEYLKIEQPAYDKYLKIQQPAYEEYLKIKQPANEEYLKTIRSTFWKIFKDKNNRKKVWK